jgi:hypothetical protein
VCPIPAYIHSGLLHFQTESEPIPLPATLPVDALDYATTVSPCCTLSTMPIHPDRLRMALNDTLIALTDDLEELVALLLEEALQSGVDCPMRDQTTLEQLEGEPLANVLMPHLRDYLQLPAADLLFLTSDILDAYHRPRPPALEEYVKIDECELCERRTKLTRHHLLPRAEHAFLVKRSLATREDCT